MIEWNRIAVYKRLVVYLVEGFKLLDQKSRLEKCNFEKDPNYITLSCLYLDKFFY